MRHLGIGAVGALLLLAACGRPLDLDLRELGEGFSTAEAARNAPSRPAPDSRGLIATGSGQVAVARRGDTVASIAARLGLDAAEVAAFNGVAADAALRRDEVIALPRPVPAAPAAAAPAVDVAGLASAAIDRAGPVTTTALAPAAPSVPTTPSAPAAAPAASAAPASGAIRHQVQRGETAYSVARLYGVPVRTVAEWNGLGPDLSVREGQYLLVPPAGAPAPLEETEPGQGTATPVPPSAAAPPPDEAPLTPAEAAAAAPPAPQDLGEEQAEPTGRMVAPVEGPIIRAYAPGRNEGIDIGAPAGTEVRAADAGTVAAVTRNTAGIEIVVIRNADGLLTVYTHLDVAVAKDDRVGRGEVIGTVAAGDPSFLHFEVRRGMASQDPTEFLP